MENNSSTNRIQSSAPIMTLLDTPTKEPRQWKNHNPKLIIIPSMFQKEKCWAMHELLRLNGGNPDLMLN